VQPRLPVARYAGCEGEERGGGGSGYGRA
jgi:hypothetical protein